MATITTHTRRNVVLALLSRLKRTDGHSASEHKHSSVGVLAADWEYVTNIAAHGEADFWRRFILREGCPRK